MQLRNLRVALLFYRRTKNEFWYKTAQEVGQRSLEIKNKLDKL